MQNPRAGVWRKRIAWVLAGGAVALGVALLLRNPQAPDTAPTASGVAGQAHLATANRASAPLQAAAPLPRVPLSAEGLRQLELQREQVRQRLSRAQEALARFEAHARYPHESRPAREHPDQLRPFDPITEEHPLRSPGGTAMQGVKLITSQDRLFASGPESARVSVSLVDGQGRPLPLRITRSTLKEVTPPGRTAQTVERPLLLTDDGQGADQRAGDGVLSALIVPALQGFGQFAGTVRLEVWMEYGGQPGFTYFDLAYTPQLAARWLPGVSEKVVEGSLRFGLRADVLVPGRYVVSARIDDAQGQPVAMAFFNEELGKGEREIPLKVFGRLLHDEKPAFPLRVRDVEAFLLLPDTFPDRVMLPRLAGVLHTSAVYPLSAFSPAQWSSAERDRYLAELGKDVKEAEEELKALGGGS